MTDAGSANAQRSANAQGDWWGRRAGDWSSVQEPTAVPLYASALSRLAIGPGTRVLDAGCGAGLFAEIAARRGGVVVGVDVSEPLVAAARSRFPGPRFEVADVEALPFEDGSFDVVTAFNVFQYADRPAAAFAEAARVAARAARVLVAVWGDPEDCEALSYAGAVNAFLPSQPAPGPGALALSDPKSLDELAAGAGLAAVEEGEVEVPFLYPDLETALRGALSAGPAARAIEIAGERAVRTAVAAALAPYRLHAGGYRLENRFRYAVFEKSG
jgi:SAM-dependent methyltransferase